MPDFTKEEGLFDREGNFEPEAVGRLLDNFLSILGGIP